MDVTPREFFLFSSVVSHKRGITLYHIKYVIIFLILKKRLFFDFCRMNADFVYVKNWS